MKNKYIVLNILMIIPIVITAICLIFMPDKVPMHYNLAGQVDRMGSKYEQIIFPIITIGMGIFFLVLAKNQAKKKEYGNEKVLVISGICTLCLFNLMTYYSFYKAFTYTNNIGDTVSSFDMNIGLKLISISMGVLLCVLGNIMPKVRLNSVIGLRTTWSMKNEDVWMKSQRFGGISFVICGLIVIIANIFISGLASAILTIGLLIIDTIVSVIATYQIYKKYCKIAIIK